MEKSGYPKCEYGCGKRATHLFKNGKWCCSRYVVKCPVIRNKISRGVKKGKKKNRNKLKNNVPSIPDNKFFELIEK